eukprot:1844526-Prymnesium_polylepis.1
MIASPVASRLPAASLCALSLRMFFTRARFFMPLLLCSQPATTTPPSAVRRAARNESRERRAPPLRVRNPDPGPRCI